MSPQNQTTPFKSLLQSETDKLLYRNFLAYLNTLESEASEFVGYILSDGRHLFSKTDLSLTLIKIAEESIFSDRLWVVVSVAYLEDQLRRLLLTFLSDSEISNEILDPNQNLISSLVPMAKLSLALGLISKEWYEILKRVAQLRNKFAHLPNAKSFSNLIENDGKNSALLDSLTHRYKVLVNNLKEDSKDFSETYQQIFINIYNLLQFSIDHIATPQNRLSLENNLIIEIRHFHGLDKETIQLLLNESS